MVKAFLAAGVAAAAFVGAQASAATYNFDLTVGTEQVTGFIETDDTIGVLFERNILNYGYSYGGKDYAKSSMVFAGLHLSATATDLIYDFSATSGFALFFGATSLGQGGYLCFQNSNCFDSAGSGIGVGYTPRARTGVLNGSQVIASVAGAGVPEPAAWALMIGGFGIVGSTFRRRKAAARIAFA